MYIHLLAVDRPQFSLVQVGDVAVGRDVFQIGEKGAVRRCGGDSEAVELKICMWPTSILLRKGHQIRVALAGADARTFRR